jgi:hypothetical protein
MNKFRTRAQYLTEIARAMEPYQVEDFKNHPSGRVRRAVDRRVAHLGLLQRESEAREAMSAPVAAKPVNSEFATLVARFTAEGKKNPEASARASMAARKQAEQKKLKVKTLSMEGGF